MLVLLRWHSGGKVLAANIKQLVCMCNGAIIGPPTDRASLRLLHGARQWWTQGACLFLPLALWWRVLAARTKLMHLQMVWLLQRGRPKTSIDIASLLLLHGYRWRQTELCVLVSAASTLMESACRQHRALAGGLSAATEPT